MKGRLEHEQKKKNLIENKIIYYPSYMRDFYYSMESKTYNTIYSYVTTVCNFLDYLINKNINIEDINIFNNIPRSIINEFFRQHRYIKKRGQICEASGSHRARELYGIKKFYSFLVNEGIVETNLCSEIEVPKDNKENNIISLNSDEVAEIEKNIKYGVGSNKAKARQKRWNKRDFAIVQMGFHTGLRVSALSEINIEDISFKNKNMRVIEKGHKEKVIFLDDSTLNSVKDWLNEREQLITGYLDDGALFISNKRKRLEPPAIRSLLQKYSYNINKHVTPHKMRSTLATNLYELTGDIYAVSNTLGHSRIETTKRYTEISDNRKREITNLTNTLYEVAN